MFEGLSGGPGSLVKYNPLTNATSAEVWNFIRVMNVPYNVLHEQGYISIGCEPCTKPVLPNQVRAAPALPRDQGDQGEARCVAGGRSGGRRAAARGHWLVCGACRCDARAPGEGSGAKTCA